MNVDGWWAYNYPKNLDKQEQQKLIVGQTVPSMRVCADTEGDKYLNNVRVNGIHATSDLHQAYLLGALNGPVADFVFRRIGKPKEGDYFEANRQFIAPLPIPNASPEDRTDIAAKARSLQTRWTHRRDLLRAAAERLDVLGRTRHSAKWLWPELPSLPEMIEQAPQSLRNKSERRAWAEARLDEQEAQAIDALQAAFDRGGRLDARYAEGELKLFAGGTPALSRIYLDESAGRITEAYWRYLLIASPPRDAARFANDLRRPPADAGSPAAQQFIRRVSALADEITAIDSEERAMNEKLYALYNLSPAERLLVERDAARARR